MPPAEESPFRLMVEGVTDMFSIVHLLSRHTIDWDKDPNAPYIQDMHGIDNLIPAVSVAAIGYRRLGIVVDADDTAHVNRFEQLRGQLGQRGIALPPAMDRDGLVVPGYRPGWRVGVWIMPDNESSGFIEDFLGQLVPEDDRCWTHATQATEDAKKLGAPFKPHELTKSVLHSWLAWQDPPGLRFGEALAKRILGHDSDVALRFVRWFKKLFSEDVRP
jgi:hypothetical protein